MPQIKEYQAPQLGLSPSDRGTNATANTARRVGGFFNQNAAALDRVAAGQNRLAQDTERLGGATQRFGSEVAREGAAFAADLGEGIRDAGRVAVDYVDHQQIMAGAAHGAELFNALNQSKDEVIKSIDPNDPSYGQKVEAAMKKWREDKLAPSLDQYREAFTTEKSQQWAEHFVDSTRQHMFISSSADVSRAAGIGVKNAIHTTVNTASKTVFDDPTALKTQLDLLDHSVTGMVASSPVRGVASVELRSEVLEKGKEAVIKSAAQGYILKTGQMPPWLDDPAYAPYVNGGETKMFQQYAIGQQRANFLTQKGIENYEHTQDVRAATAQLGKTWSDNVSFDENGKATIKPGLFKEVMAVEMAHPGAATEHAKAIINWGQAQQRERKEIINSDGPTRTQLYNGMFDVDHPTTDVQILRAAAEEKLSPHDTSTLLQLNKAMEEAPLKGPVYRDTMKAVEGILGVNTVIDGHQRYANFVQQFVPEYLKQFRAGTLPPNALDTNDENSLIGKAVKSLKPSQADLMNGWIAKKFPFANGGGAAPEPPKLPPVADREKNKTYPTPSGPRKWTGTGWVIP